MVEDVFTWIAYVIGAITMVGGLIALGILLVGALAGAYTLGAWIIDGLRD